jgi:hypothetical protein
MTQIKKRGGLRFLVFPLALLLSCRTVPQIPDAVQTESGFIPLESGAFAYIFVDVKKAKPLLELVNIRELGGREARNMLDRTQSAVVALYPPGNERRLQLAAWGSYPARRAEMALGASREWERIKSADNGGLTGAPYWYSPARRLSIALGAKQAFVVSWADKTAREPFAASPGVELPEDFAAFRRNAALACWLESPASLINQKLTGMQIPLELPAERLFISVIPKQGQAGADRKPAAETGGRQYEALIRIQVASAVQAKALAVLLALARNMLPDETDGSVSPVAILFANPPVQDGRNLDIKTAPLSETEIALLFAFFSL